MRIRGKKGIALISVYLVITVLIILGIAYVERTIYQNKSVLIFKNQTIAFNLAESGLDAAVFYLRSLGTPPIGGGNLWITALGQPSTVTVVSGAWTGTYQVTITDLGSPGGTNRRYRVTSKGEANNSSVTLTNYLQTDNYARYIWFTDAETYNGTNVWFWTQDYLDGPTHTNGHFNIYGNPTFAGEVESVDNYIRYYNNGNNINSSNLSNPPYDMPNFLGGIELGTAEPQPMPTQALNLRTASTNGGLRLTGNSTLLLNADGTMNLTNSNYYYAHCGGTCSSCCTLTNQALPANGALFVSGGNLTVSGVLQGRLTVGCSRDIFIPGNITYNTDPRVDPSSTDTLGIISEADVVISSGAPTDLEIDGSIMALNTSFLLNNWDDPPPRGTLTVFGGIIQQERGPVGTFSGGNKVSGYSKNYVYDGRLLTNPPPFVPTTGDYVTLSWKD